MKLSLLRPYSGSPGHGQTGAKQIPNGSLGYRGHKGAKSRGESRLEVREVRWHRGNTANGPSHTGPQAG